MTCPQCIGIQKLFDDATARRELRRWQRRGPPKSTALLLQGLDEALAPDGGTSGLTFLDIGGGIGAIQHALMDRGAAGGTHVDASPAYLQVSRGEAEARGYAHLIRYVEGDFVELAPTLTAADIVTLDRVVCCYPDMPALLDAAASRATSVLGLVFPRDHILNRLGVRAINLVQALRRHPFRVYLHPPEAVHTRLEAQGFRRSSEARTLLWHAWVYRRARGGVEEQDRPATDPAPSPDAP